MAHIPSHKEDCQCSMCCLVTAVEPHKVRASKLAELCQIMFDPENQPPQITREEAWEKFKQIDAC